MSIPSVGFLVGLFAVAAVILFLPAGRPRQILLAVANAAFLATQVPNLGSWAAIAAFLLSGYVVGTVVRRPSIGARSRKLVVGFYIAGLLVVFAVLKEYRFLAPLVPPGSVSRWVVVVGLSYMLFRQIHYVVDMSEGQIETTNLWTYLNYQLNLFGLLAGPIQRFEPFQEQWRRLDPVLVDQHELLKVTARFMIGVMKVAVIGSKAAAIADWAASGPASVRSLHGIYRFAKLFYGYPAFIYLNFSGYCDVVIAGAMLVGLRMPENFNQPYLARNPIDFWTRWHISLTSWIRDYLFTPLYKGGLERRLLTPQSWGHACLFTSLFLAGVWHGSTWNFAIFGALHGLGVVAAKAWEERIVRRHGRPGLRAYLASRPVRVAATVANFNFVCFTLLFFSPDLAARTRYLLHFLTGRL